MKIRELLPSLKEWVRKNLLITFLFLFTTAFFFWQHASGFSWDFASYVLNAKYMFSDGFYFEWYRAPLMQVILGIFSIFSWVAAEYLYILFVSIVFLLASLKLAETLGIDRRLFYALLLNPVLVVFAVSEGTELLSLSLIMLFIHYMLKGDSLRSGLSGALAFLARFTNLSSFILILFTKDFRKISKILGIALVVVVPWLIYNWIVAGSPLTGIADYYALNIFYRDYVIMPVNPLDFLLIGNYLIPLAAFGIYRTLRKKAGRADYMMLLLMVLIILSYVATPLKVSRYLYNMILPLAYFSAVFLKRYGKSHIFAASVNIVIVIAAASLTVTGTAYAFDFYRPSLPEEMLGQNCMISSNHWVPFDYYGIPAEPPPREWQIGRYVNEGYRIVIYKSEFFDDVYSYLKDSGVSVISDNDEYVIYGDESKCKEPVKVDIPYLKRLDIQFGEKEDGEKIETDPCTILFKYKPFCDLFTAGGQ